MTIAIYYISTGPYKQYFPPFLESLRYFFPDAQKTVMLISDGLDEYDGVQPCKNVNVNLCQKINHYPWPIITLFKHWHILQNFNDQYDYVCYFNGNAKICKNNPVKWCDYSKLNVSYHACSENSPLFPPNINIDTRSQAYIEGPYTYINAGFFFGKSDIVKRVCSDIVKMLKTDLSNCIFPQWHDESYMNKWVHLHKNEVNYQFIMTTVPRQLSDTRFIILADKTADIKSRSKI